MADILSKIKKNKLTGKSGAGFPVWEKWAFVSKGIADIKDKDPKYYIICNGSEGEPGVKKDEYILINYGKEVVNGMRLAMEYFSNGQKGKKVETEGIIYLNPDYYKKLEKTLRSEIDNLPIKIFKKSHGAGYIGGEETSLLNHLEGKRVEPRFRPPFPPSKGLWGRPTLVHNIETYYDISLIEKDKFKDNRFYTINGDCLWTGVYELSGKLTIKQILEETHNYPKFEFFVQIGGDACGPILNSSQLDQIAFGAGSITIYSTLKHSPVRLIRNWLNFYINESCGQCTPCREGVYRLKEIFDKKEIDWKLADEIMNAQSESSFCALGCSVPVPILSLIKNVVLDGSYNIDVPSSEKEILKEVFKNK